jgi:hypothetical protein
LPVPRSKPRRAPPSRYPDFGLGTSLPPSRPQVRPVAPGVCSPLQWRNRPRFSRGSLTFGDVGDGPPAHRFQRTPTSYALKPLLPRRMFAAPQPVSGDGRAPWRSAPVSGAASSASATTSDFISDPRHSDVAAPEDGRTPIAPFLPSLTGYPGVDSRHFAEFAEATCDGRLLTAGNPAGLSAPRPARAGHQPTCN